MIKIAKDGLGLPLGLLYRDTYSCCLVTCCFLTWHTCLVHALNGSKLLPPEWLLPLQALHEVPFGFFLKYMYHINYCMCKIFCNHPNFYVFSRDSHNTWLPITVPLISGVSWIRQVFRVSISWQFQCVKPVTFAACPTGVADLVVDPDQNKPTCTHQNLHYNLIPTLFH